jgi:nucleotide-binding universal stress UspA family protein
MTHPTRNEVNIMQKILVCLDGSEISLRALAKAQEWATGELHLLHVGAISLLDITQTHLPMGGDDILPRQIQERLEKNGNEILSRAQASLNKAGLRVETHLELGHPGDLICQNAEQLGVDCVLVGSHGRNGLQRALLGSVSDFVVHHCKVPVMVIK